MLVSQGVCRRVEQGKPGFVVRASRQAHCLKCLACIEAGEDLRSDQLEGLGPLKRLLSLPVEQNKWPEMKNGAKLEVFQRGGTNTIGTKFQVSNLGLTKFCLAETPYPPGWRCQLRKSRYPFFVDLVASLPKNVHLEPKVLAEKIIGTSLTTKIEKGFNTTQIHGGLSGMFSKDSADPGTKCIKSYKNKQSCECDIATIADFEKMRQTGAVTSLERL